MDIFIGGLVRQRAATVDGYRQTDLYTDRQIDRYRYGYIHWGPGATARGAATSRRRPPRPAPRAPTPPPPPAAARRAQIWIYLLDRQTDIDIKYICIAPSAGPKPHRSPPQLGSHPSELLWEESFEIDAHLAHFEIDEGRLF